MSEIICEECRFRIGVRWLWIEKHGRELLYRPVLIRSCGAKGRRST